MVSKIWPLIVTVLVLVACQQNAQAVTLHCGGVFIDGASITAATPAGLGSCSATCFPNDGAVCGLSGEGSANGSWVYPPVDTGSDSACYCAYIEDPCPDGEFHDPITGLCPDTAEDPPGAESCSDGAGNQNYYSCSRPTYAEAVSCAEGASTPAGCELETTTDPSPPECTQSGIPVSQGGTGAQYTCVVDLTQTGADSVAGDGLPQVDSDDPTTSESGDVETTTSDDGEGCTTTASSQTNITNNNNGTITTCQVTTTTTTGAGCTTAGGSTSENCTTRYTDGSTTNTETNTTQDGSGTTTGTTTTTSNEQAPTEEPEEDEGSVSGGTGCSDPPICQGDALQCAIISQEFQARCDFNDSLDGFTPDAGGDIVEVDNVDVGNEIQAILNTSGWITDRSCPTPPSVSLFGTSVSWDFSFLCELYEILSYLVLAFAAFKSFKIFMGAF